MLEVRQEGQKVKVILDSTASSKPVWDTWEDLEEKANEERIKEVVCISNTQKAGMKQMLDREYQLRVWWQHHLLCDIHSTKQLVCVDGSVQPPHDTGTSQSAHWCRWQYRELGSPTEPPASLLFACDHSKVCTKYTRLWVKMSCSYALCPVCFQFSKQMKYACLSLCLELALLTYFCQWNANKCKEFVHLVVSVTQKVTFSWKSKM